MINEVIFLGEADMRCYEAAMIALKRVGIANINELKREKNMGDYRLSLEIESARDFFHLGQYIEFFRNNPISLQRELSEGIAA
jgi:hypothetical protein